MRDVEIACRPVACKCHSVRLVARKCHGMCLGCIVDWLVLSDCASVAAWQDEPAASTQCWVAYETQALAGLVCAGDHGIVGAVAALADPF